MRNKKLPYLMMAIMYSFLILGALFGFLALGVLISYLLDVNLFLILIAEAGILIYSSYISLKFAAEYDSITIEDNTK